MQVAAEKLQAAGLAVIQITLDTSVSIIETYHFVKI